MQPIAAVAGVLLLLLTLWDGFETVLLPRRVTRGFRLTRSFYAWTWRGWAGCLRRVSNRKRREQALSIYAPLSMLLLLIVWAASLVCGFGLVHWGMQTALALHGESSLDFLSYLYASGTTFFTLGLGDIVPKDTVSRGLTVLEAGIGFGFLALVISYLPVIYSSFSHREANITLLDARAGTPPSAVELLRRHARGNGMGALEHLLGDWERWSADLLESHISYAVLSYYRSQHDNQSWLGSLTTILDACSLVLAGVDSTCRWQAQLTFAMARHAVVDLAQVHNTPPDAPDPDRLPPKDFDLLYRSLAGAGIPLAPAEELQPRLAELRRLYEPYVNSLARYLMITVPAWLRRGNPPDNWQTSAWERHGLKARGKGLFDAVEDDHEG